MVPAAPQQGDSCKITLQSRNVCALSSRQGMSRDKYKGRIEFAEK
jgi:hypothetical protein